MKFAGIIPFVPLAALVALGGCGGNYSNEDLDFELALPERDDVVVKLPAQSLETADSAEHYRSTRGVVKGLNGMADAFLSLIDYVRSYPPTERSIGHRQWGPFPAEGHPGWNVRMVLDRVGQPMRFEYRIEFQATGSAAPWAPLFSGNFAPLGGVRHGRGELHFTAVAARAAGYPLDGLIGLQTLDIAYDTSGYPISLHIDVTDFPLNNQASYQYLEQQDGSGSMRFVFPFAAGGIFASSLEIYSRWVGSGAGRADVKVLAGLATGMKGVDCWGIDTRATYVHRDWEKTVEKGSEATCVYPAP
jgi:hypothetical protein